MKAAGALLSRPAAYRAAIAAADTALAHLPRFVIYNGLNAWGKHREVPQPAQTDLPQLVPGEPGSEAMSSRDEILASIRANLPSWTGRLPSVPRSMTIRRLPCSTHSRQPAPHGRAASRSRASRRRPGAGPGEVCCSKGSCARDPGNHRAIAISPTSTTPAIWRMSTSPSCARRSPSPRPARCC